MSDERPAQNPDGTLVQGSYAVDYAGMATEPFPDEARKILAESPKHEDVEIKPDGIVFMPGVWYRRQLTRAFGAGGWALKPTGPARTVGNAQEYSGALYCLGRWVSQATGGCDSGYMSHADMVESAKTDCLTKCCKDLGMATELWEKTWREQWQDTNAEKYMVQSGKDQGKYRWRLKEKRDAKAANLMGEPGGPAKDASAQSSTSRGSTHPVMSTESADSATHVSHSDTGEAAPQGTYENIAVLFKKHKFTKLSCTTFLKKFGVEKVTAMTERQARACEALLNAYLEPGAFQSLIEQMKADGVIT